MMMRYLSSISLALIVHVLLSIVVLMALACTATPAATPTPSGPMYSEEEAVATLKEHLQTKTFENQGREYPCWLGMDDNPSSWSAKYDLGANRWDVTGRAKEFIRENFKRMNDPLAPFTWSVYERTKSIVATGDEPLNQLC